MATRTPTRITATELARNLSDILNRVRYKGETFVVVRNGAEVAVLRAPDPPKKMTMREFVEVLERLPRPGKKFADDIEWARKNQPPLDEDLWDS
jgi:prevent-host-death family protein